MICPRCSGVIERQNTRCRCGYRISGIADDELEGWFEEITQIIEAAYMPATTPMQQSGISSSFEDWVRLRIPICEAIERPGSILDMGCANGFLLECLLDWTREKGVEIVPYGLDISLKLVELARARLPQFQANIFHGNALDWKPPLRFDYVRTMVEYVPTNWQARFLKRLLNEVVAEDGALLVAQYRSRKEDLSRGWIDDYLRDLEFTVERTLSGYSGDGKEKTRIAILRASQQDYDKIRGGR